MSDGNKRNKIALEYLDRMGLLPWADHLPSEMSGGQKQRIAIARALISEPKVILADEPTGSLSSVTSFEVLDVLQEISKMGTTIVCGTHEQEIALCTQRIIRLKDGIIEKNIEQQKVPVYV